MSAHRVLYDLGLCYATSNNKIATPESGGTFRQNGMAFGTAVVGAGTYKLPDNGLPMYVRATGAVTITNQFGDIVAYLASGQMLLCLPISSTLWAAAILSNGTSAIVPVAKTSTSATATTITPAAGALTGAQLVVWENTADGTLALTTRTAEQLYAESGIGVGGTWVLKIVNRGNNTITITEGDGGVTFVGEKTIATLTTRTYVARNLQTDQVEFTCIDKGTIET